MARPKIHSSGGRVHATPFSLYKDDPSYIQRQVTQTITQVTSSVSGTISGVAYFTATGSVSSNDTFVHDWSTGGITGSRFYVTNTTPVLSYELATKQYVDSLSGGSVDTSNFVTTAQFQSHTGDSTIHFTQDSLNLSQYALSSELASHTGDQAIHYTLSAGDNVGITFASGTATISGSSGGSSVNPITGSASSVLVFVDDNSASGFATFDYDNSTERLQVTSASVSSVQIHRQDWSNVDNTSTLRNAGGKTPIWDNPYYWTGDYKQIWISKELKNTGTNFQYVGVLYSDVDHLRRVTTYNGGDYSYVIHWANYGASVDEAGMRTVVGAKRYTYKQITVPIRTASSTTDQRVWVGISDNPLTIIDYDAPTSYNIIAFRYIPSTNWYAYVANGTASTTVDTGVAYSTNENYLLRITIYGIQCDFYINNVHVAQITTNVPSDTQDMYAQALIKNTATSTSTKELGISHLHMVMT